MATYRFNVHFVIDPSPAVSITPAHAVEVAPEEINLLTFTLTGPPDAKFPSTPIQWLGATLPHQPMDLPPWFVMHRHGDKNFALWDFNSVPETPLQHFFQVCVYYLGQTYTHDPSIINEPPVG
jgi:hypothetical protein